jgi:hypothetical protein
MKSSIFSDITPSSPLKVNWRFGGTGHLHLQGRRINTWRMPSSGMWRRLELVWTNVPPKRRFTQDLHGATSQKTAFFIVNAVKTTNLNNKHLLSRWFLALLIHRPWIWRRYFPPKPRVTFNGLHGVISQKTEPFQCYSVRYALAAMIWYS